MISSLICPIRNGRLRYPDRIAIRDNGVHITYAELDQKINIVAQGLIDNNVKPGRKVAFVADRQNATFVLFWAIFRIGAIAVPLSPKDPPAARARVISDLLPVVFIHTSAISLSNQSEIAFSTLLESNSDTRFSFDNIPISTEQPCCVLSTSGTSGAPKYALLSFGNLYFNAMGVIETLEIVSTDIWLLSVPIHHAAGIGIMFRCALAGAKLAIESPAALLQELYSSQATRVSLVPTQLLALLKDPLLDEIDIPLKSLMLSGAPVSDELIKKARSKRLPIVLAYGLTEMSATVTLNREDTFDYGTPLPHSMIRINADREIEVRGKTLFLGYVLENSYTSLPLTIDGWFPTGDLGEIVDGRLLNVVRKDDIIISGGENINPIEVERMIKDILKTERALVLGVPDPVFGERPALVTDVPVSPEALLEKLATLLPKFKVPIAVYQWPQEVDQWPKVSRKKMRAVLRLV